MFLSNSSFFLYPKTKNIEEKGVVELCSHPPPCTPQLAWGCTIPHASTCHATYGHHLPCMPMTSSPRYKDALRREEARPSSTRPRKFGQEWQ